MISSRATSAFTKRAGVPAELEQVVDALARYHAASAAEVMELWLELDLTMPQFAALNAIWRAERISGRQLAEELGVTPASVVKVCDRLEARGHVERIRDTTDRRVWWFQLTKKGQEVFESLVALNRERIGPALQGLSTNDRETLARILIALSETIQSRHARQQPKSAS